MRGLIATVFLTLWVALPLSAQSEPGIEATIQQQVEAFQANDLDRAFSFASPGIRQTFGNARNFAAMVSRAFPMVWRPLGFEFKTLRVEGGQHIQTVLFTDGAGALHLLEYQLSQTANGWQINSVVILQAPDVGV